MPKGRQFPLNLHVDGESGPLVRALPFADTAVGRVPTQIEFDDYRDSAGVKVPFTINETWSTASPRSNCPGPASTRRSPMRGFAAGARDCVQVVLTRVYRARR